MNSFANDNRQYSDGQNNREAIPDEIQRFGWKPPVKLPDGTIEEGDFLAANHLNFIFNDVYKLLSSSLVVTEKFGDNVTGFRRFSNGDIEAWGRATTGANGSVAVSFASGTQMPGAPGDIQLTDTGESPSNVSVRLNLSTVTNTGFTVSANNTSNAAVVGRVILWKAVYHG